MVVGQDGLSSGIIGNIYPLLALSKINQGQKWKLRAYKFAVFAINKHVTKIN